MSIKAQALGDFIVEFTYSEEDETLDPNFELAKEGEAEEKDGDTTRWKLFIDESSNHQSYGVGFILQTSLGEQMEYAIRIRFKSTNNRQCSVDNIFSQVILPYPYSLRFNIYMFS